MSDRKRLRAAGKAAAGAACLSKALTPLSIQFSEFRNAGKIEREQQLAIRWTTLVKQKYGVVVDLLRMAKAIREAAVEYGSAQIWKNDDNTPDTLDVLADAADEVLRRLSEETNAMRLCHDNADIDRVDNLVEELKWVRGAAPKFQVAVTSPWGRSREPTIHTLVRTLAEYWSVELGLNFTRSAWLKETDGTKKPKKESGAAFVYDVVEVIDPARLPELPNVIKNVRADIGQRAPSSKPTKPCT